MGSIEKLEYSVDKMRKHERCHTQEDHTEADDTNTIDKLFKNLRFKQMYDPMEDKPNIKVKKAKEIVIKPGKNAYSVKAFKEREYESQKVIKTEEDIRMDVNPRTTLKDAITRQGSF